MTLWTTAQTAEVRWWSDCANTYDAETVQFIMAREMGLKVDRRYRIRSDAAIADVGGGPVSLLLKTEGFRMGIVVDPGAYPPWVQMRYEAHGIGTLHIPGERFFEVTKPGLYDEVWIYDTLQHVEDPEAIVRGACGVAPVVRLFEWIEFPRNDAHIHTLIASEVEGWANAAGYRVREGGVKTIDYRDEAMLGFPAVFVRA